MAVSDVASRYADALFVSSKAAGDVDETLEHLAVIRELIKSQPRVREFFLNPDVDPVDKVGMLDRVTRSTWSERVQAFIRMVAELGRAESLVEIVDAFRERVDADRGRLHITVKSARPLVPDALKRLKAAIEKREGRVVDVNQEIDGSLIGGLQISLDHRVIDGSVRRHLTEIKDMLKKVSVA